MSQQAVGAAFASGKAKIKELFTRHKNDIEVEALANAVLGRSRYHPSDRETDKVLRFILGDEWDISVDSDDDNDPLTGGGSRSAPHTIMDRNVDDEGIYDEWRD